MFKKVKKFVKENKDGIIFGVVTGLVVGGAAYYFGAKDGVHFGYMNGFKDGRLYGYSKGLSHGATDMCRLVKEKLIDDVIEESGFFGHALTITEINNKVPEAIRLIDAAADNGNFGNIRDIFYDNHDVQHFINHSYARLVDLVEEVYDYRKKEVLECV